MYSPPSSSTLYASSALFLPWGVDAMERPRLQSWSASAASPRSSFESRHKSLLSVSSSIDYQSSRTSVESLYRVPAKNNMLRASMPPGSPNNARRAYTEPVASTNTRYGAGGIGRQQNETSSTVLRKSPSRLSSGIQYKARIPGEGFKKLPKEILLVIVGEVKKLHLEVGSLSCSTCWMRDLTNLALSCKKWRSASRCALYEDIQLSGTDSSLHVKRFKVDYGTRMKLLRRTLRLQPDLAGYVKCLKVPAMPDGLRTRTEQSEYLDLCASLIMACPNLERFPGLYPTYRHEFSRIVHALSSRLKLTERVWIIDASSNQRQKRYVFDRDSDSWTPSLVPGLLRPEQSLELLKYHMRWEHLHTLVLHCNEGGTIDSLLFSDIFNSLPALENLHISSFPAPSFDDSTLTSLPRLRSLRLEDLAGISDTGLSHYAASTCSKSLTHLSLIHVPLLSLPVLSRLFSNLVSLTHFTISQEASPALPIGVEISFYPYLESETLKYLHWELTEPDDDDTATDILANSISFNGFPVLRTIRAPTDFHGFLQKLCKPRNRIELPGDRYRNIVPPNALSIPHTQSLPNMPLSSARSTFSFGQRTNTTKASSMFLKSPPGSTFSLSMERPEPYPELSPSTGISLVAARRLAQARIDAAANQPKYHIIIWDSEGRLVERHAVGGYMGDMNSKIYYSLKPDVDGKDDAVVSIDGPGGLLDAGEEKRFRDGCTGGWNLEHSYSGGRAKGGRDKWWHTERGRWREIELKKFF